LLQDFESIPNSIELSEWLGKHSFGARKRLFETFRASGRWLEKKRVIHNPWSDIDAPRVPVPLLEAPSPENIRELFAYLDSCYPSEFALRNKAIIGLFVESGLRLFELSSIKPEDIDWSERTIQILGKGQKEGRAPFGQTSEALLRKWLSRYRPNGGNIWGIDRPSIQVMLKRLHKATGITCNPHSFRRTFACSCVKPG